MKLYFCREFLTLKGVTASLRKCCHIIWTKYQSSIIFQKQPFYNWAVDDVVCCARSLILILSDHSYMMM